jgi:molybdopterin-guanine dinucleotide biosynthesis protein B
MNAGIPVLGFAAFSGTGKTTLLRQLIPLLTGRGVRVGMVKMSHHDFEIDVPGKDSYELRHAGAQQVLVTSPYRWALITEKTERRPPDLWDAVSRMDLSELDLVLVEGFRHQRFAKIELHRVVLDHPLLFPDDDSIIAIATDDALSVEHSLPQLRINDPEQMADFILSWLSRQGATLPKD